MSIYTTYGIIQYTVTQVMMSCFSTRITANYNNSYDHLSTTVNIGVCSYSVGICSYSVGICSYSVGICSYSVGICSYSVGVCSYISYIIYTPHLIVKKLFKLG